MKSVRLVFKKAFGGNMSITMRYAKDGLTEAQVRTAMQAVIDNDALTPGVTEIVGAEIIDHNVTDLI